MKKILIFLLLLSGVARGQMTLVPGYTNISNKYQWLGGKFLNEFGLPVRDTSIAPAYIGQMIWRTSDSSLYVSIALTGNRWVKIGRTAGVGLGTVRSVNASATGALSVIGGPITDSGTLQLTWTGSSAQYVRGNGVLGTLNTDVSALGFMKFSDTVSLSNRINAIVSSGVLTFNNGLQRVGNEVHALYENPIWDANRLQSFYVDATRPCNNCLLVFDSTVGVWSFMPSAASGATYTNGYGLNLTGTTFLVDTTKVATLRALSDTALVLRGLIPDVSGFELLANKATDFSTLNNTLYPTTQAVADYVAAQGFLTTETDSIALSKTVTLNQGNGVIVTGTASQALSIPPSWTIRADTNVLATKAHVRFEIDSLAGTITAPTETDPVWIADSSNYYTKGEADATFQPIGSYLTTESDPVYTANGVPKTRTITINGVTQDLSANRTWTVPGFDSTTIYSIVNGKVDSVTMKASATVDTLKYYKSATPTLIGYIDRPSGDYIVSPGVVTHTTGLGFDVSAAVYYINGQRYTSSSGSITLNAADATNPRIDVIALNTSGQIVKITGTPATNPATPQVDPDTQIELTSVLVPAGATTIPSITTTTVYDENVEWTTGSSGTISVNFNSTAQAFSGTKSAAVASWSNGGALLFTNASPVLASNYSSLKFYLRLGTALNNQNISVQFLKSGVTVSNAVNAQFTKATTGAWQSVTLNMSSFTFTQSSFDRVRLTFTGNSSTTLYVDLVQLQGGITQPTNGTVQNAYASVTNGTTTATATGSDVFKVRTDNTLTTAVTNNDATHGDNILVKADTLVLSTRAWRQKGIDSLASLISAVPVPTWQQTLSVTNGSILTGDNIIDVDGHVLNIVKASGVFVEASNSAQTIGAGFGAASDNANLYTYDASGNSSNLYLTTSRAYVQYNGGTERDLAISVNGNYADATGNVTLPVGISAANLSLGTATSSTLPVNIDAGTDITLPVFSTTAGLVPGTTSGTTNFLRADGTWAAPAGTTYTFANGLTNTSGTVRLGGTLTQYTTIDARNGDYEIDLIGDNGNTSAMLNIYGGATNPEYGIDIVANTTGISAQATLVPIKGINANTSTNSAKEVMILTRSVTSGNGAVGLGATLRSDLEMTSGATTNASNLITSWTNATSGAQTAKWELQLVNGGTVATKLEIAGSGQAKLNTYGSGTFTGTAAYALSVDASGNIIETAAGGGGGSYTDEQAQDAVGAMVSSEFTYTDATPLLAINSIAAGKITGLATVATTGAYSDLTGTPSLSGYLVASNNLSDVGSTATSRTNLGATTVGSNIFTATNPSAVRWIRVNADNTITFRTAAETAGDIGALTSYSETDPLAALKANNLSDLANAGTARTNLGATTVGSNLFTLTNPSAIGYLRTNADNTVTHRTYANVRTDLGLVIGTDVQAYDADLTTWAGLTPTTVGQNLVTLANPSAIRFIRINADNTVSALDAATFRTAIGAGTGGGDALTTSSLAQFASTTSLELLNLISNETGTGALVFGSTPTLATPVINGLPTGTGVASAATASTLVARDANANITANNWLGGYTTTATAAGTTTLTVGSTYLQYFTGTTTQTVALPAVSTLALGTQFLIVNNSTGAVTVNSSGGNLVQLLQAGTSVLVTSIATSGTGASVWSGAYSPASTQRAGFGMSSPTASENAMIMYTPVAITITGVQEALAGSSPSVTYVINYGSSRSSATSTIVASHAATSTTGASATLNVTAIPAGSYIWITISAVSGTINDFHITMNYRQ